MNDGLDPALGAILPLVGVVLGGLITLGVTWAAERRREGWAARKAARLFQPSVHRCMAAIARAEEREWPWGDLYAVVEANLEDWDRHAEVFPGTLDWDRWFPIYSAVRGLQLMTLTASHPATPISDDDHLYLDRLSDELAEAAVVLVGVALAGVRRPQPHRRLARRLRYRLRPASDDELVAEVARQYVDVHGDEYFERDEDRS